MRAYMDAQVRRSILMQHYNAVQNKTKAMLVANKKGTSPLKTAIRSIEEIQDSLLILKLRCTETKLKMPWEKKYFLPSTIG